MFILLQYSAVAVKAMVTFTIMKATTSIRRAMKPSNSSSVLRLMYNPRRLGIGNNFI